MDRRFRKARTYSNWCRLDGLRLPEGWRWFEHGDVVEFQEGSKLVQRTVQVELDCETITDGLSFTQIAVDKAYVRVGRKRVRVTEAPPMRLISKA